MTKFYQDQELTFSTVITLNGVNVDPSTVTFKYRIGKNGSLSDAAVTKIATGVYDATITPTQTGVLYGTWQTTGTPTLARPEIVNIFPKDGIVGYGGTGRRSDGAT